MLISFVFFFFSQKTAYDLRISDWSSDVCSSDLKSTTSFPRKVWHLLVGIKDALALIFLLLFFVALFGLLAGRPNAGLPVSKGALVIELDGIVSEQPAEVDPFAALSGGARLKEVRVRDVVHALEVAADDSRVTSVVLDLDRFLGGGQVSLAEIGAAIDKVRAKKKPVLAFATAYTTDSYQVAAHASEIWADGIGGVAIAGPGGSRLYRSAARRVGKECVRKGRSRWSAFQLKKK